MNAAGEDGAISGSAAQPICARSPRSADPYFVALCCVAVATLAAMKLLGVLDGKISPDTASYLASAASLDPWGEPRHPLYGVLAIWLGANATEAGQVAVFQALLNVIATLVFYGGARSVCSGGAFVLALVALLSQAGLYNVRLVQPEAPAIACLLMAFGGILAASNSNRRFALHLVPMSLAAGVAYILRPSFLSAIFVLPILWWLFATRNGRARRVVRTGIIALMVAMPFLLQSAFRLAVVGDFNIVSFGGFSMSAMAGFMLTPELIDELPQDVRPTARAVFAARKSAEEEGSVARTPLNSVGKRSFVSAALGYFDIYARNYDNFLYNHIKRLRAPNESWVAFNKRMMSFSIATVFAAPLRWLAWIGGATSRLVGRMIVTNAAMLIALGILFVASVAAMLRRTPLAASRKDLQPVCMIALAWLASTAPLAVLVTFPATRYIDTAALLLAAPPALLAIYFIEAILRVDIARPALNIDKGGL